MTNRLTILDLRDSPYMGGINNGLFRTAREFAARDDLEVINAVLSDNSDGWVFERARAEGLPLEHVACGGPLDVGTLGRLKRFIEDRHVELIITRDYRGNIITRTLLDMGVIDIPHVSVKHGVSSFNHWRIRLYHYLNRRPLRRATRVIAVDKATYAMLLGWGVSSSRLRLVPNPAPVFVQPPDEALRAIRSQFNMEADIPVVLYLGRIEQKKGVFELLSAHQQLSEAGRLHYTVFVGDGSCRAELMERASAGAGAERAIFTGVQIDVEPFLAISDILTLPSYREGMPNAILEAMAAGKPIVATQVGGIPDLVDDGVNGLLLPPQDVTLLCNAFVRLLDDMDQARVMGEQGYLRASNEYSVRRIVDMLVTVYREALSDKRRD